MLEILVAFSILAVSLGILLRLFSSGLENARVTDDYIRAILLAESELAAVGNQQHLEEGETQGTGAGNMRWKTRVWAFEPDLEAASSALVTSGTQAQSESGSKFSSKSGSRFRTKSDSKSRSASASKSRSPSQSRIGTTGDSGDRDEDPGDVEEDADLEGLNLKPYVVVVNIEWDDGERSRSLVLTTMRLSPPPTE